MPVLCALLKSVFGTNGYFWTWHYEIAAMRSQGVIKKPAALQRSAQPIVRPVSEV
jgi:hypothetical protein